MSHVLFRPVLTGSLLLALTACGGPSAAEPAPTGSAPEAAVATRHASAAADPGSYSSEDLAQILGTISTHDGTDLTVLPADQVTAALGQASQLMDGVTVTPAECNVLPQDFAELAEDAELAIGVAAAPDGLSSVSVSLAVAEGAEDRLAENAEKELALVSTCSTYTIEMQGVIVEGTMESVETTVEDATSFAVRSTVELPDGPQQDSATVTVARGDLTVVATSQATDSASASPAVLEQLAGRVLAAAEEG